MTSLHVVKGTPDDDELAAVVTAVTILAGRRRAAGRREAATQKGAAVSGWRRTLRGGALGPIDSPTGRPGAWRDSLRGR
ncbi:MAG: acyl-CoA carboxylase epsilon subunit [Acidothermaceae bacterium]